jgi:hypothetical protein
VRSDPTDHLRNIKAIMPDPQGGTSYATDGTLESQPFNPEFLEDVYWLEAIRCHDWLETNTSRDSTWAQVTNRHFCRASANAAAKPEYLPQLARLFYDSLDPNLRVYLEYGNEIWNSASPWANQAFYAGQLGWSSWQEFQVHESVNLFKAFEDRFGVNSPRLVKVVSGFSVQSSLMSTHFAALDNTSINPHGVTIDAYAVAPYIHGISIETLTGSATNANYSSFVTIANQRGVDFICYEAGSHQTTQDVIGVSSDTRMYNAYQSYLNNMDNYFSMYNECTITREWAGDGAFGAKRYTAQPMAEAHKYRALYDYGVASG